MELKMKRPELEDRELLERYLAHADTRSCEMTFGNIYLWSRFYNTGFAIVEDNLIFGEVDGVYSYTFPVGPGDKKKTIDALMEHCKENGEIFQHFGHTETFKIYDVTDGKITGTQIVDTNGNGHGALAGFLVENGVDTLICGGIGGGAQNALAQAGIRLFGGVSGNADEAVNAFLAGTLGYDPDVHCNHHDHHGEEGHSCEDHGCGSHSCH